VWRVSAGGSEPGQASPYWWLREPVAYESGLPEAFGVLRLFARVDRADGDVALWLEDGGDEAVATPENLRATTERLGVAQRDLVGVAEPWLAHGFLDEYLRLHGAGTAEPGLVALAVWEGYTRGFGEDVRLGFLEGARRLRWLPTGHKPEWDATLALIERLASII